MEDRSGASITAGGSDEIAKDVVDVLSEACTVAEAVLLAVSKAVCWWGGGEGEASGRGATPSLRRLWWRMLLSDCRHRWTTANQGGPLSLHMLVVESQYSVKGGTMTKREGRT